MAKGGFEENVTGVTMSVRRDREAAEAGSRALGGMLVLLAVALVANTLLGPLVANVLDYPVAGTLLNQLLGLEVVTVLVVAPMAVCAAALLRSGHPAAPFLGFGAGTYSAYMFLQYVLGPSYTSYQPAAFWHLAVFSLGCAVAAWCWVVAVRRPLPAPDARRRRWYGVLLLGLAAFVVSRYLPALAGAVSAAPLPQEFAETPAFYWSIVLLDLGVAVPATVAAAAAMLRGARIATAAVYAVVAWYVLVPASVAGMGIAMLANGDPNASSEQTAMLSAVAVLFAGLAVWVYRPLLRRRGPGVPGSAPVHPAS